MAKARIATKFPMALLPLGAALMLAACGGGEERETTYEAGVTDQSGGEFIVTEQTPAVDVNLPGTAMTPVPVETPTPDAARQ